MLTRHLCRFAPHLVFGKKEEERWMGRLKRNWEDGELVIDKLPHAHIIPPNKNIDEDEYALNDGLESRRHGESPARDDSAEWPSELQGEISLIVD